MRFSPRITKIDVPEALALEDRIRFYESTGAYNTTAANKTYDLNVVGSTYILLANGTPILSGPLRDYSSSGTPYNLSNYIFVGDDTTSAAGAFEMSRLAVTVPEPASAVAVTLLGLIALKRRRA